MSIAIIMGSQSDMEVAQKAYDMLKTWGIPATMDVISAHRNPDKLRNFLIHTDAKIFIAIAGGAAHLAGVIASHTARPVIGVPVKTDTMGGMDSLLSMVQMPTGIPVATVAINGAANAAILAMQMLGITNSNIYNSVIGIRMGYNT